MDPHINDSNNHSIYVLCSREALVGVCCVTYTEEPRAYTVQCALREDKKR